MGLELDNSLYWEARIDYQNLFKDIDTIKAKIQKDFGGIEQQSRSLDKTFKKLGAAAAAYFTTQTVTGFVSQLIKVRGEFQQLEISFSTMLKSKTKADRLMAEMVSLAAKTPFELSDVATAGKQLLAYGFGVETITENITMLGNVASGVGAPLGDIVYLYGTLQTQGRAYTKDIMQFTGRGIPIVAELAKQFGVSSSEVQKLVEAGKVGFPEVEKAFKSLTGESGMFYNLMERQAKSLPGQISNMKDAWAQLLNTMGQSTEGFFSGVISGLTEMIGSLNEVIGQSTIEKMKEEGRNVNIIAGSLMEANVPYEQRVKLLKELGDINPNLIEGLNAENLNYEKLKGNLEAYNLQLANKIVLQRQQDKIAEQAEKEADAREKALDRQNRLRAAMEKEERRLNQYGGSDKYRAEARAINQDQSLTLDQKAEKMFKLSGSKTGNMGVDYANYLNANKLLKIEQEKMKAMLTERQQLVKDLGIVEETGNPTKNTGDGGDDGTQKFTDSIDGLKEKLKSLKSEFDSLPASTKNYEMELVKRAEKIKALELEISNRENPVNREKAPSKLEARTIIMPDNTPLIEAEKQKISQAIESTKVDYSHLFEDIDGMDRKSLKERIKNIRTYLAANQELTEERVKMLDALEKAEQGLSDNTLNGVFQAIDGVKELSAIIGGELGDSIEKVANSIGDVIQGYASGNYVQMAAGLYSFGKEMGSILDGSKKAAKEQKEYYEGQSHWLTNINQQLREQIELAEKAKGVQTYETYDKSIEQTEVDLKKIEERARSAMKVVNGTHQKSEWKWYGYITKTVADYADVSKMSMEEIEAVLKEANERWTGGEEGAMTSLGIIDGKDIALMNDYMAQYKAALEQSQQLADQLNATLTGTTADDIASALTEGFRKGETAIESYSKKFSDLMTGAMAEFEKNYLNDLLNGENGFYTQFASAMKDDKRLSETEVANLQASYSDAITAGQQMWDELTKAIPGINGAKESANSLKGDIKGITETTAGALEGQVNAMRINVVEMLSVANRQLETLQNIEDNTRPISELTETANKILDAIGNNSSNNALRANGL